LQLQLPVPFSAVSLVNPFGNLCALLLLPLTKLIIMMMLHATCPLAPPCHVSVCSVPHPLSLLLLLLVVVVLFIVTILVNSAANVNGTLMDVPPDPEPDPEPQSEPQS